MKDNSRESVHMLNHMMNQDISFNILPVQPHSFYDLVTRLPNPQSLKHPAQCGFQYGLSCPVTTWLER